METDTTPPLLVRDLMSVGVLTCVPNTPLTELLQVLLEQNAEAVVVLGHDKQALGVVTQAELIDSYCLDDFASLTAEDIMREQLPQIPPEIPLKAAAQIMQDRGLRVMFIMHNAGGFGYPAAVLTYQHLLRHMAAAAGQESISDLGIKADRKGPIDSFIERREQARQKNLPPEHNPPS